MDALTERDTKDPVADERRRREVLKVFPRKLIHELVLDVVQNN